MSTPQSYANHAKLDRKWHGVLFLFWILFSIVVYRGLFGYIIPMISKGAGTRRWLLVTMLAVRPIVVLVLLMTIRGYALTLQDRIIRLEEHLRHHEVMGKKPDPALTLSQLIALRFASDEELPSLAQQAISQRLTPKAIKQAIKQRKADHQRV